MSNSYLVLASRCLASEVATGAKRAGGVLLVATALAGCSADFARIDGSRGLGYSETGSLPTPPEPIRPLDRADPPLTSNAEPPPRRWREQPRYGERRTIDMVELPAPPAASYPATPERNPPRRAPREGRVPPLPPAVTSTPTPPSPRVPVARAADGPGGSIEVVSGDTLYALSRRHDVALSDLMRVNGLTTPVIKPGQRLVLPGPAGEAPANPVSTAPAARDVALLAPAPAATPTATADAAVGPGRYRVKAGDSLYAIARRHGVGHRDLQAANGITDPTKVRPGTILTIPPKGTRVSLRAESGGRKARLEPTATGAPAPAIETSPAAGHGKKHEHAVRPGVRALDGTLRNGAAESPPIAQKEASLPASARVSVPPKALERSTQKQAAASPGRFRWPVRGKIVAEFGPRPGGGHNDGINIAVSAGTAVHAVEEGEVTYADDKLRSYGNLIVIRHPNGLVTAYAHNAQLLVKRGDKVRRGQPIAKAGKTGDVTEPQLHFEVRQGATPVDPLPYMERL
jgi:murein DD-endopeptidase MepM/ murein hydrolase activator NlpD